MTDHPAKAAGCTPRQIEVFEQIATGQTNGHHPGTLDALERRGLIEYSERTAGCDALGTITIRTPYVPIHHHYAFCQWASEQPDFEDEPE